MVVVGVVLGVVVGLPVVVMAVVGALAFNPDVDPPCGFFAGDGSNGMGSFVMLSTKFAARVVGAAEVA